MPPGTSGLVGPDDLLDLWFALSKREWSSLVIAPAHPNGSAADLTKALAEVGKYLSDYPVSALTLKILGPASVRALAALAQHGRGKPIPAWRSYGSAEMQKLLPEDAGGVLDPDEEAEAKHAARAGQVIIAIPSVLSEPLGIAVARAADAVVLSVELGRTKLADAARSVEAIGRENVVGTCLVRREPREVKACH